MTLEEVFKADSTKVLRDAFGFEADDVDDFVTLKASWPAEEVAAGEFYTAATMLEIKNGKILSAAGGDIALFYADTWTLMGDGDTTIEAQGVQCYDVEAETLSEEGMYFCVFMNFVDAGVSEFTKEELAVRFSKDRQFESNANLTLLN